MKSKKRHATPKIQQLVLSIETLTLIQASFRSMEEALQRSMHASYLNLSFAQATFTQVQQKVSDMLHAPGEVIPLDFNELIIIRTCLQLYSIELLCLQASPERNHLLVLCSQVEQLLPPVLPSPIRLHD